MQVQVGSPPLTLTCIADTGSGCEPAPCPAQSRLALLARFPNHRPHPCAADITVPTPQDCPGASQALYSPAASTTADAGAFPAKNPWDAQGPPEPASPCQTADLPLANGSTAATCTFNFNQSSSQGQQAASGVVATDQLRFGAGLTGFDTWEQVELRAPLGAVA